MDERLGRTVESRTIMEAVLNTEKKVRSGIDSEKNNRPVSHSKCKMLRVLEW